MKAGQQSEGVRMIQKELFHTENKEVSNEKQ